MSEDTLHERDDGLTTEQSRNERRALPRWEVHVWEQYPMYKARKSTDSNACPIPQELIDRHRALEEAYFQAHFEIEQWLKKQDIDPV